MSKTIAIHQPETMPWAGYINKMMLADEFVVLDSVQFKKNNYQNRNRIIHEGKPKWVTCPVELRGRLQSTIMDTRLAETVDWRARNIKVIMDAYKDSKYYEDHIYALQMLFSMPYDTISKLNMSIIDYIRTELDITTPLVYASTLDITSSKSELVLDICKERGASVYLSGAGGRDYLDTEIFEEAGIEILYQEFEPNIEYKQRTPEFIPFMSTIDLLMNNSKEDSIEYLTKAFSYNI